MIRMLSTMIAKELCNCNVNLGSSPTKYALAPEATQKV